MSYSMTTLDGGEIRITDEEVQALAGGTPGEVLTPESPDYDEVRSIWNAMIDRRPGLILRCAEAADVVEAVNFVRKHRLVRPG